MKRVKIGNIMIDNGVYTLSSVSGMDAGSASRNEKNYVDTDGAKIDDVYFQPRTIEINGYIFADNVAWYSKLKKDLLKGCNPKKEYDLYYFDGHAKYYAKVRPDQLPSITPINFCNAQFTLYLIMESFYWLSESDIISNVFVREDKLKGTYTLPTIFTERISKAIVKNDGDVEIWPTFEITCESSVSEIIIKNNENGDFVKITKSLTAGEKITIDNENKTIISDKQGNLINFITKESDFICIYPGASEIECEANNVSVLCLHRNRYLGV